MSVLVDVQPGAEQILLPAAAMNGALTTQQVGTVSIVDNEFVGNQGTPRLLGRAILRIKRAGSMPHPVRAVRVEKVVGACTPQTGF